MKELDGLISDFFVKSRDVGTAQGIALCEGTKDESVDPDFAQFKRDLINLLHNSNTSRLREVGSNPSYLA